MKQVRAEQTSLDRLLQQEPPNKNGIEYAEWQLDVAKCKKMLAGKNNILNGYQQQLDESYFNSGFDT